MTYTVRQLAKVSGVTVRTLRYYDEIGLLKPAYYGENEYRYYEQEQLLMLQQILFFRALGFSLSDIQRIITSSDFDKLDALQGHRKILEKNLDQTKNLIKTIDKTILHLRGELTMRDEEFFDAVRPRDSKKQKEYEKYLLDSGKMSQQQLDDSWKNVKDWQPADWEKFKKSGDDLMKEFAQLIDQNIQPSDPKAQQCVKELYDSIAIFWQPTKENFIGITQLYHEHPDFKKYYDSFHPKLLGFLTEAMKIFAERELK